MAPTYYEATPQIELTILVGNYAQTYYLEKSQRNLTERVKHAGDYLPTYFPLPHPSPRNNIWQAKHPWFVEQTLPILKNNINILLGK